MTVGFNASDVDTTDNLIFEIRSGPAGGSVVNNGDGTFTFNPDDDFQFLVQDQSRDVTFSYVAIDDSGAANHESALQTVTVTVDGAFDAPVQNAQEFLFGSENLNPWGPGAALSLVDVRFLGIDEFVSVGDTSIIDGIVLVPSFTTPAVYSPVIDIPAVYAPVLHFPATYAPVGCVLGVCVGGQKLTDAYTTGGGLIAAAYTIGGDLLIPAFTTPAVETPDLGFGIDLGILFGLQSMFGMTAGEVDVGLPFDVVLNTPFQAENGQQITVSSSFAFLDSSSLTSPTDTVGIDVLGPNVRYELDILVDIFGAMEFNVGSSSTTLTVIDEHNTHVENDPLFGDGILRGLNIIAFDAADDAVIPVFSNPASPVVNVDAFVPDLDSTGEIDGLDPSIWTSTASDPFLTGTLDLDAIASFFSTPVGPKFGFPYVLTAEVGLFPFSGEATLDIVDLDIVNSLTLNQDLTLNIGDLLFDFYDESGTLLADDFTVGNDITFTANDSNGDGRLDVHAVLDPQASLTNVTSLGFESDFEATLLELLLEFQAFGITLASETFGPLLEDGFEIIENTPIGPPLVDETFALTGIEQQTFDFWIDIA